MTTAEQQLTDAELETYRRDGVLAVRGLLDRDEVAGWREAALETSARLADNQGNAVFTQNLNVWRSDPRLRALTLDPRLGALAERLAGVPLRLWHDQLLIKQPRNARATELHQDQPYWPHRGARATLTAWIPLGDVPVERGCMTFIPGSQRLRELERHSLEEAGSLFAVAPELQWEERVTIPLRAGDLTFHDGRTAHMATPNLTDEARVALAVIWVDAETVYDGSAHPVTDQLGLEPGGPLDHELFPRVA